MCLYNCVVHNWKAEEVKQEDEKTRQVTAPHLAMALSTNYRVQWTVEEAKHLHS